MITINTAFDEKISEELVSFLKIEGISSKQKGSTVILNQDKLSKEILRKFLEKTNKQDYEVREISSKNFLISKTTNIEKFGLATCEICGFVTFEEELFAHRRAHGI